MPRLAQFLRPLSDVHREALAWFGERAGMIQHWPKPLPDGTLLASKAKAIYKPSWMKYALSIRQNLDGPYPDRDPEYRPEGTWTYAYFQEGENPDERDVLYTNRGLLACMRDRVPVGVMRQVKRKPNSRYHILGLALVDHWDAGYFFMEGFAADGLLHNQESSATLTTQLEILEKELESEFDPQSIEKARERTLASIVRRRGQRRFRRTLIHAYEGRCAISGCNAVEALEAAHIIPYAGEKTNHPSNGLLLRADLHTLFDLGLIAIDASTMTVLLDDKLLQTDYGHFKGKPMASPDNTHLRPSREALDQHRKETGL